MPVPLIISPKKLTKAEKNAIARYLMGESSNAKVCRALGITHQRLYTMITAITRNAVKRRSVLVEDLLHSI